MAAEVEGRAVNLGGPKARLLLAVLLEAERQMVTANRLFDRVWYEEPPEGSSRRDMVHSCVSDLRGVLKQGESGADSWIPKREPGYRLLVDPNDVDLHRFRALVRQLKPLVGQRDSRNDERIARLGRAALAEWGGRPFADLGGPWVDSCRRALREEHRDVRLMCLAAELRLGCGPRLVPELKQLVDDPPADEPMVRLLMHAYHQLGDRVKAVDLFERFQRHIEDRYATSPDRETRDLYRRIIEQDPALNPSPEPSRPNEGGTLRLSWDQGKRRELVLETHDFNVSMGRSRSNNVHLEDERDSRFHGQLSLIGPRLVYRHLGSHPAFLITPTSQLKIGKDVSCPVGHNDRLRFASGVILVEYSAPDLYDPNAGPTADEDTENEN
ncbi:MAG: BTAD domain-containing putative transcriptional regulator [Actinoallomurus sp.]